jgi:NADH:ubiquinone oxidoreductase subunit 4 (subunit M)
MSLKLEKAAGLYLYQIKYDFFANNQNLGILEHFVIFSSGFGDAILVLSFFVGIVCMDLMGPKNLLKSLNNISIFYIFNFFVSIMVSTNNLLIMFISFELIFLPTIYYVYKFGYSKKIDKAIEILFYWTLFGSFLVLCNLCYLYFGYNTLNYIFLCKINFSPIEIKFLFFSFLLGFGIKIPLAPLHF